MKDALAGLLRDLGLPAVAELSPVARSRRYANWHVRLEDGSARLLRIAVAPPGWRGLDHEAAARAALPESEVPRVEHYQLVDRAVFGAPASLSSWMDGQGGTGVLDVHPGVFADLCALCGTISRTLEQDAPARYGLSVVDGRFAPIRPTWTEEYVAQVHEWAQRADAVGASLGPVGRALLTRIEQLRPALDEASTFALIHGDLQPTNLILEVGDPPAKDAPPTVKVVGVVDWELAGCGDPLMALAPALELPDEALAHFVDGYGSERIREALDGRGADRIEAYAIGRVFQYLALVVSAQIEGGGPMWGYGMAYASRMGLARVEAGFARKRLEAVLALEALPTEVPLPDHLEPVGGALRRALGRLTCRPVLGRRAVGPWMGAVAAALRDLESPDEGWVKDAHLYLDTLGPEIEARGFEPVGPRGAWMGAMDARVRSLAEHDGLVLGLWWLAAEALGTACGTVRPGEWSVPDGVLRGLQGFIEGVAVAPALAEGPSGQLLRILVGTAAARRLAELSGRPVDERDQAARRAALLEAWEDLTVFGGVEPVPWSDADAEVRDLEDPSAWLVPVVLLAASTVPDLPVPRDALVGAICKGL